MVDDNFKTFDKTLSPKNIIIDVPDLNRFNIGDAVHSPATASWDEFNGIVIGIELRRVHGLTRSFKPELTLLHDVDCISDGFGPNDLEMVKSNTPKELLTDILYRKIRECYEKINDINSWGGPPIGKDIVELKITLLKELINEIETAK